MEDLPKLDQTSGLSLGAVSKVKPEGGGKQVRAYPEREFILLVLVLFCWSLSLVIGFPNPVSLIQEHWLVSIVAFFAAAVANATAVGGGFIFLPLFSFYYNMSGIESLKLALSTQAFGMTSGAVSWPKHYIVWRYLWVAIIGSGIGMTLGTFIWSPSSEVVNKFFGATSIVLGIIIIVEIYFGKKVEVRKTDITKKQILFFYILCMAGGLINAWVSIGIGEIVALWLLFKWHFSIAQAIATGVVALAFCSILGFIYHSILGGIIWHLLVFTAPGVILGGRVGALLGARLAENKLHINSGEKLKFFVASVILIDGVVVLLHSI